MATTTLMTAEELAAMPDDGCRYELMRGELIRMSPTGFEHLEIAGLLNYLLRGFAMERDLGVVGGEGGFMLERDPDIVLAPDIVFVRNDRLPPKGQRQGFLELAPDLAVEILSPSDRAGAVNDKVLAYLEAGVQLVWIVDPRRHAVTIYAPDRTARVLLEGDELDGGDVLPGFRVAVADLFA